MLKKRMILTLIFKKPAEIQGFLRSSKSMILRGTQKPLIFVVMKLSVSQPEKLEM